jgi:hypothetical protein
MYQPLIGMAVCDGRSQGIPKRADCVETYCAAGNNRSAHGAAPFSIQGTKRARVEDHESEEIQNRRRLFA